MSDNQKPEVELTPCPFCPDGGDVTILPTGEGRMAAHCKKCNAGMIRNDKAELVAAWNRRVSHPANNQVADLSEKIHALDRALTDKTIYAVHLREKLAALLALVRPKPECYLCGFAQDVKGEFYCFFSDVDVEFNKCPVPGGVRADCPINAILGSDSHDT